MALVARVAGGRCAYVCMCVCMCMYSSFHRRAAGHGRGAGSCDDVICTCMYVCMYVAANALKGRVEHVHVCMYIWSSVGLS